MRRFLLVFFIYSVNCSAQGVNNLWLLGYDSYAGQPYGGVNMDFTSGLLNISYQNRKMNFEETNGVISDRNGNLLFSSNGVWIANSANDTMINGSGLNPSYLVDDWSSSNYGIPVEQGNLIIPFPNDSMRYYLFHNTVDDYGPGTTNTLVSFYLYYSIIDMSGDSGRGTVTKKNKILLNDSLIFGKLTACKHANGRDWWLFTHQYASDKYYKFLITPDSIWGPYIQHVGTWRGLTPGQTVFSPDGNMFAVYDVSTDLEVFDFDRCSGNLTLKAAKGINDSASCGGIAFSANSQVLYVSSFKYVYQLNLNAADIPNSQTTVAVWDTFYSPNPPLATTFYLSQLAPDGKIYINCNNSTLDIHCINKPDSLGLACDLQQHSIHLPAYNAFTIPNHPNYFLGILKGSICDSLPDSIDDVQLTMNNKIQVFPNPIINGEVTFTYSSTGETKTITVYNIEGRTLASYNLPQWSSMQHVKLPKLAQGVYLARLLSSNQSASVKFVVE